MGVVVSYRHQISKDSSQGHNDLTPIQSTKLDRATLNPKLPRKSPREAPTKNVLEGMSSGPIRSGAVYTGTAFGLQNVKQEPLNTQNAALSSIKTEANTSVSATENPLTDPRVNSSAQPSTEMANQPELERVTNTPNSIASEDSETSSTTTMPDFLRSSPDVSFETGQADSQEKSSNDNSDKPYQTSNKKDDPPHPDVLKKVVIGQGYSSL